MTPLENLVSSKQLDQVEPTYHGAVLEMATSWQTKEGLQNPYVMLWCSAKKAKA